MILVYIFVLWCSFLWYFVATDIYYNFLKNDYVVLDI